MFDTLFDTFSATAAMANHLRGYVFGTDSDYNPNSYAGRLGFLYNSSEHAGSFMAEHVYDYAPSIAITALGLTYTYLSSGSAPAPAQPVAGNWLTRAAKKLSNVLTATMMAPFHPIQTFHTVKDAVMNYMVWPAVHQGVAHGIVHRVLNSYLLEPMRPLGVQYLRPFMERLVPHLRYLAFGGEASYGLRDAVPNAQANDAHFLLKAGATLAKIPVSIYQFFTTPSSPLNPLKPEAYLKGEAHAQWLEQTLIANGKIAVNTISYSSNFVYRAVTRVVEFSGCFTSASNRTECMATNYDLAAQGIARHWNLWKPTLAPIAGGLKDAIYSAYTFSKQYAMDSARENPYTAAGAGLFFVGSTVALMALRRRRLIAIVAAGNNAAAVAAGAGAAAGAGLAGGPQAAVGAAAGAALAAALAG